MAKRKNKQSAQDKASKLKERQREELGFAMRFLGINNTLITVVAIIIMFAPFSYIYNSDVAAKEAVVSGIGYAVSFITREFQSTASIYAQLAVPFYYYAKSWVLTLALVSFITLLAGVLSILFNFIIIVLKKYKLLTIGAILNIVSAVTSIVCYVITKSMSKSDILPTYCSGNPACSISGYSYITAIVFAVSALFSIMLVVYYIRKSKSLAE